MKKTFYAVYLDCLSGDCVFETKEEAEEFRQNEIENSEDPMTDDDISDVFEVQLTQEEFDNRVEV